jgi:hypothetical protein
LRLFLLKSRTSVPKVRPRRPAFLPPVRRFPVNPCLQASSDCQYIRLYRHPAGFAITPCIISNYRALRQRRLTGFESPSEPSRGTSTTSSFPCPSPGRACPQVGRATKCRGIQSLRERRFPHSARLQGLNQEDLSRTAGSGIAARRIQLLPSLIYSMIDGAESLSKRKAIPRGLHFVYDAAGCERSILYNL